MGFMSGSEDPECGYNTPWWVAMASGGHMRTGLGKGLAVIAVALFVPACAVTHIEPSHPLLASSSEQHARVYFLRPTAQRSRGVADMAVRVDLGKQRLLSLGAGEYTVVPVRPGAIDVVMKNLSFLTSDVMPVEVWRARPFVFVAGESYFILADFKYEEFRGVYFVPRDITNEQAASYLPRMRAVGLAKSLPVPAQISVSDP